MPEQTIFEQYDVDTAHTRYVAGLAHLLFDKVRRAYGLPQKIRDLLESGALLHDVGVAVDAPQHHIAGRNIVLNTRLDAMDLDADKRAIVACMVAFHRKKVRPETEPAYVRLNKKDQQTALSLAALLRVADGLDYSHTQTTRISACEVRGDTVVLRVSGPHAEEDAAQAAKKADLWRSVFESKLSIVTRGPQTNDPPDTSDTSGTSDAPAPSRQQNGNGNGAGAPLIAVDIPLEQWGAVGRQLPDNTLTEVGRRLLRSYFQKLLSWERDVRKDKDIEAVHDMRVATRRLRAILPVIEEVAPKKQTRSFRKSIQKVARSLGAVRDCDVFLVQIHRYTEGLPAEQHDALAPLTNAIQQDRAVARKRLLLSLSSDQYLTFKRDFAMFLTDNAETWDMRMRLCDMLGSRIWQRYESLRAYETLIDMDNLHGSDETILHEARIAGKRLRYLLELAAEVAPEERAGAVMKPLSKLQDCLGGLQDIAVEKSYIAELKTSREEKHALDTYLAHRETERVALLTEFPSLWQTIVAPDYQRGLAELIISL